MLLLLTLLHIKQSNTVMIQMLYFLYLDKKFAFLYIFYCYGRWCMTVCTSKAGVMPFVYTLTPPVLLPQCLKSTRTRLKKVFRSMKVLSEVLSDYLSKNLSNESSLSIAVKKSHFYDYASLQPNWQKNIWATMRHFRQFCVPIESLSLLRLLSLLFHNSKCLVCTQNVFWILMVVGIGPNCKSMFSSP